MNDDEGFTLIELLVVVIIVGVLAAIAIPNYLGTKRSAYVASATYDLQQLIFTLEAEAIRAGSYAGLNGVTESSPVLALLGYNGRPDTTFTIDSDSTTYCVEAHHARITDRVLVARSSTSGISVGTVGC